MLLCATTGRIVAHSTGYFMVVVALDCCGFTLLSRRTRTGKVRREVHHQAFG
ncbi:MAG TPA: hypothetical protein VLA19_06375 [Herpetosiphonaceae bacterium]|nr:hypothetical protein [Herpetosiphonaceae bacterium]